MEETLTSNLRQKVIYIKALIHDAIQAKECCTDNADNPLIYQENFNDVYIDDENKPSELGMDYIIGKEKYFLQTFREKKKVYLQEFYDKIKVKSNELIAINAILQFCIRWRENIGNGKNLKEYPESVYNCINNIQDESTKRELFNLMNKIKPMKKDKLVLMDITKGSNNNMELNKTMPAGTITPGIISKSKIPQSCHTNVNTRKNDSVCKIISPVKYTNSPSTKSKTNDSFNTQFSVLDYTQWSNMEQNFTNLKSADRLSTLCKSTISENGIDFVNSYNLSPSVISQTIHNVDNTQDMVLDSPNTQYSTLNFTQDTLQISGNNTMNESSKDDLNATVNMSIVDSDKEDDILNQPIEGDQMSDSENGKTSEVDPNKADSNQPSGIANKSILDQSVNHHENSSYWPPNMPMAMRNKATCPPIENTGLNGDALNKAEDDFIPIETSFIDGNTSIFNRSVRPNQPENSQLIDDSLINMSQMEQSFDHNISRPLMNVSDMPSGIHDMSQLDANFGYD